MHHTHRLLIIAFALIVLIPAGTTLHAVVTLQDRYDTQTELKHAIDSAAVRYRQRGGVQATETKADQDIVKLEKELITLQRRKRTVRLTMASIRRRIRALGERNDRDFTKADTIAPQTTEAKEDLAELLRMETRLHRGIRVRSGQGIDRVVRSLLRTQGGVSLTDVERMIESTMAMVEDLTEAATLHGAFVERAVALATLRTSFWHAQRSYDTALATKEKSSAQLAEIRRIMADVHAQVLKIQGELARIDARIRSRAERKLIEKGLIDPERAGHAAASKTASFSWPVYGPVSAGFHNESYKRFFGVAHEGMDIVVPQETPVAAASDGVVFLVRDGGAKGYTYVLIGHRDGYATLYGHLSAVSVKGGQDVDAGQIIGLSGGKPGTQGAGPMTTASHLHFEVIKAGVNVDPKTVLP